MAWAKERFDRHAFRDTWSRRITDGHRMAYRIEGDDLLIAQLRFHSRSIRCTAGLARTVGTINQGGHFDRVGDAAGGEAANNARLVFGGLVLTRLPLPR